MPHSVELQYPMPDFKPASPRLVKRANELIEGNPFTALDTVNILKVTGANLGLGLREYVKIERQLVAGEYFRYTAAFPHTDGPESLRFINTYTTTAHTVGVECDLTVFDSDRFVPGGTDLAQIPENAKNLALLYEAMAAELGTDWLARATCGDEELAKILNVRNFRTQQTPAGSYLSGETVFAMHYSVPRQPHDSSVRLAAVGFHN